MRSTPSSPNLPRRRLRFAALVLAAVLAQTTLAGRSGCGTSEQQASLESPVQALGSVFRHPDDSVEAELVLISTISKDHVFIDSAQSVELVIDGATAPMKKDATRSGRWSLTQADAPELELDAGTRYLFRFTLDDPELAGDEAGGRFVGEVVANGAPVSVTPAGPAYVDHTLDLTLAPALTGSLRGVIEVYGPDGALTYGNFDRSQPRFDGSKHARLQMGSRVTLPGTAFPVAGDYRIVVYAMTYTVGFDEHISAELGVLSGFLAGPGTEISVQVD